MAELVSTWYLPNEVLLLLLSQHEMGLSKGLDIWLELFHDQTDVLSLWIEGGPALALHLLCRTFGEFLLMAFCKNQVFPCPEFPMLWPQWL